MWSYRLGVNLRQEVYVMELSDKQLISINWYMVKCCVCGEVQGYKDAGKELKEGDLVVSHTYCVPCSKEFLSEFIDVDY